MTGGGDVRQRKGNKKAATTTTTVIHEDVDALKKTLADAVRRESRSGVSGGRTAHQDSRLLGRNVDQQQQLNSF